jgi:hypothetical protein
MFVREGLVGEYVVTICEFDELDCDFGGGCFITLLNCMVISILYLAYNMGLHYLTAEANPPPTSFKGEVDRGQGP